MVLLNFKQRLTESLMLVEIPFSPSRKRGRPLRSSDEQQEPHRKNKPVDQKPLEETSKDGYHHYPMYDDRKEAIRCKSCAAKVVHM